MAQVNYQEVGEQVTIARPSEALHKLRALVAAIRVVETYGEGWGKGRGGEGRRGEGRGRERRWEGMVSVSDELWQ